MSQHEQPGFGGITTSDAVYGGRHWAKWWWVIGAVVILLIAAGTYAVVKYRADQPSSLLGQNHRGSQLSAAEQLANAQAALTDAHTPAEKAKAYAELGAAYVVNNQSSQAITSYQSALGSAPDTTSKAVALSGLADAYLQTGQRQQAADTLKQLVALYQQSGNADQQALIPKYQRLIDELEGPGTVPGT